MPRLQRLRPNQCLDLTNLAVGKWHRATMDGSAAFMLRMAIGILPHPYFSRRTISWFFEDGRSSASGVSLRR